MGNVALEGFGGGAGLNFDVKAYNSEPDLLAATPKNNTIGVITTTPITGWIISPTQPSDLSDGMVWIRTGVSGEIEFNALKKNGIQVYPFRAMQYTSGALKYVKSQIYQNGSWMRVWSGELFERGDQYEDITGGWSSDGYTDASYQIWPGEITEEAISLQGYKGYYTMLGTDDPIDLTGFSGVRAVCRVASAGTVNYALGLFIASSKNNAISSGISWASAGAGDTEMMLPFPSGLQRAYVGVHAAPVDDALGTVLQIELY